MIESDNASGMFQITQKAGGVLIAIGLIWTGLSLPRTGWKALSETLPPWLVSTEGGLLTFVAGGVLIAISNGARHFRRRSRSPTQGSERTGSRND